MVGMCTSITCMAAHFSSTVRESIRVPCKRRFEGDMLLLPSLNANMRLVAASSIIALGSSLMSSASPSFEGLEIEDRR